MIFDEILRCQLLDLGQTNQTARQKGDTGYCTCRTADGHEPNQRQADPGNSGHTL